MNCPRCERPTTENNQKFCNGCGLELPAPAPEPEVEWNDPQWAATGEVETTPSAPVTEATPTATDPTPAATEVQPQVSPMATATMQSVTSRPVQPPKQRPTVEPFRFSIVTFLGAACAVLSLVAMFTKVLSITTSVEVPVPEDAPVGFRVGDWLFADLAGNLPIAGLIAAICMMAGAVASGLGWRWGAGIAGGGGLAFAGLAALAIGVVQIPIDAAHEFINIPTDVRYTMSITRDIGYWLLVAAAALGIVLFFASLSECMGDRQRDLNPWIAAIGALAAVITVVGPLVPVNGAVLSDNWYVIEGPGEAPAMLVATRLVQLCLLGVCGIVGFLLVRRYGIGLALGGTLPSLWLGLSIPTDLAINQTGPGWRNPGATEVELHGVTIIGLVALAAMLMLATVAAYDQTVRRR